VSCRYVLVSLIFAWTGASAQSATAPFAPAQLHVAEEALRHAQEAQLEGDFRLAGRLAAMAEVDARLAWQMSESAFLRRAAAQVSQRAAGLRSELVAGRAGAASD
jgi:hypothetical protein